MLKLLVIHKYIIVYYNIILHVYNTLYSGVLITLTIYLQCVYICCVDSPPPSPKRTNTLGKHFNCIL